MNRHRRQQERTQHNKLVAILNTGHSVVTAKDNRVCVLSKPSPGNNVFLVELYSSHDDEPRKTIVPFERASEAMKAFRRGSRIVKELAG